MTATITSALRHARARLAQSGDSPDLDSRLLLEHALGVNHAWLILHADDALDPRTRTVFDALIERRIAGEPVAYIVGRIGFWSLELDVTPDVLVPRPETETLVEAVLAHHDARPRRVLDLGTGSGAIALALAAERPCWQLTATDVSAAALACARTNAQRLGLDTVDFVHGRWYAPLARDGFDVIVSNPPYVAADDAHLDAPALGYEPRIALVADDDGLADLAGIIRGARARLHPGAALYLEHGADQGVAVRALLHDAGFERVAGVRDLAGHERVSHGRLAPSTA